MRDRRTSAPVRRIGLLDLLILVAATAVGIAMTRGLTQLPEFRTVMAAVIDSLSGPGLSERLYLVVLIQFFYVSPTLAAWTLAGLIIRMRRPRPRWRVLMRQPGALAYGSASFLILLGLAVIVPPFLVYPAQYAFFDLTDLLFLSLTSAIGVAVASAWLMLALGRRWRAERGGIDRLGRLVGTLWILGWLIDFTFIGVVRYNTAAPPTPVNIPINGLAPPTPINGSGNSGAGAPSTAGPGGEESPPSPASVPDAARAADPR